MTSKRVLIVSTLAILIAPAMLTAQYEITSHTIDGGGGFSAGGAFELEGTIGQHDAGPNSGMTGGSYALVGGFWAMSPADCACLGDTNGDGAKNGADVQSFVDCVVSGSGCSCADVNASNGVTIDDVVVFVADLLSGSACP